MLIDKFIHLVEDHADQLTKLWIEEIRSHPSTKGYREFSDEILRKRIFDVYHRLGNWLLDDDPSDKRTAEHFMDLGRERTEEKIRVSEVIYALILARVVITKFVGSQSLINSPIEIQQAQEFTNRLTVFFDKAAYFVAVGYETRTPEEKEKLKKDEFVVKAIDSIANWIITDRHNP